MSVKTDSFLHLLAPIVQAEYCKRKDSKWILPSVCLAQAALETGWGGSNLMMSAKAVFGIKAGKSWKGKVYSARTKECYDGVNYTTITDLFRAYDSYEESIADYYNLITGLSRYSKAVNVEDPFICIDEIWKGGYATSPNYVPNVSNIIKSYNLQRFDNIKDEVYNEEEISNNMVSDVVIEVLVEAVLNNQLGNGEDRKRHLGILYKQVQIAVNKRLRR